MAFYLGVSCLGMASCLGLDLCLSVASLGSANIKTTSCPAETFNLGVSSYLSGRGLPEHGLP